MRVAGARFGYGSRRVVNFARFKLVRSVNFIDRENEPASFPVCYQQPIICRADGLPGGLLQSEQAAERYANQQFPSNVYQAHNNALALVRKRMRPAALRHFLKCESRQRQPFRVDAEQNGG